MTWQSELDELKHRHQLAEEMGGPEGVERQHKRGKLTIRERLAALVDPGSFREIGKLRGTPVYDENNELADFTPKAGVSGLCTLNGRRVYVTGQDFPVRGASAGGD